MSHSLPHSTPEEQGVSSHAILAFLKAAEGIHDLHSLMLLRHGQVIAEGWWQPYQANDPHMLYSLSKSFTSTAVGLAVNEGLLSVDDPVLKFFPDDAPPKASENLLSMKVRHLLSMSTGHDQDSTDATMSGPNPFESFLKLPVDHRPGTHFVYNSGASFMLAAIVQKLTGQTVVEYLMPRLFQPLGIERPIWDSHTNGVNYGGWGLYLKTEDIARFGQLLLQKGAWDGKQLVPARWVEEATSRHIDNGDDPASDWNQGYGYQFWRCRHNVYRGDGAFGQYCIVMPESDAVVAITSGVSDMQAVLNAVWTHLLPDMQAEVLPADPVAVQDLRRVLASRHIAIPTGKDTSSWAARVSGKEFRFRPNEEKLDSIGLDFGANTFTYRLLDGGKPSSAHVLPFGVGRWEPGTGVFRTSRHRQDERVPVASIGTWIAEDTFELTTCQTRTPHVLSLTLQFENGKVQFQRKFNVSFGPTEGATLTGNASA